MKIFLYNIKVFFSKNASAFTLAEVLITLAIIGVVAAITIPALISNTKNAEYVTGLKKAYSIISQATERVQQVNSDFSNWEVANYSTDEINNAFDMYKPYLNIIKDCGNDGNNGCWAQTKDLRGVIDQYSHSYGWGTNIRVFTLSDGMNIVLNAESTGFANQLGLTTSVEPLEFIVDVNGNKKPNELGKDVFLFFVTAKGVIPAGTETNSIHCSDGDNTELSGLDCAAKVLNEGKINY